MVRIALKAVFTSLAVGLLALCAPHGAQAQLASLSASSYSVPYNQPITFTLSSIPASYTHPQIICSDQYTGTEVGVLLYEGGQWVAYGSGQPINTGGHGSAAFIWTPPAVADSYFIQCVGGPPLQDLTNGVSISVY